MVYLEEVRSVSLMAGDLPSPTNGASQRETTFNGITKPAQDEGLTDDEERSIAKLKACIEAVREEESNPILTQKGLSQEDCHVLFIHMIADRAQLRRILVARKYDMDACVELFFEQFRFRARWKPQSIRSEDIPNALPSGAWRLSGYSKEGIIVSNYKLRYWEPGDLGSNEDDLEGAVTEYTKYVLFMLEDMIGKMKQAPVPQKFIVLFDLRGFSVSLIFRKDVRLMIRKLIYIAQAQYPERLHKALLVNAPMGFESAWTLIRALLDEKTACKVSFVNQKSLQKEIDAVVLSVEYGGNHDEYPLPGSTD